MPKYYSLQEKQAIVKEFKQSGLSKSKFSKLKKIGESSLFKWSKEFDIPAINEKGNFIPIQTTHLKQQNLNNENFFLKLPGNIILEFSCGFDVNYFCKLMESLTK